MIRMFLVSLLALMIWPAEAQQPSNAPGIDDMVKALTPVARTRSLGSATRNLNPTLDLTVNFDFDSATLRSDGRELLGRLAKALGDERLATFKFRVEGHTDAKGTEAYNDQLSQRRAEAVVAFLVSSGVVSDRLEPIGKGFKELLNPADPHSASNRRVRVITLP